MSNLSEKKYTGDSSNEHRIFMKDARIGWRTLLCDPMKQFGNGLSQYEYLESLGPKLGGQARRLLDNAFSALPRESLIKLADRFDEVSLPLLTAGLMTSRGPALTLGLKMRAGLRGKPPTPLGRSPR